MTAFFGIFPTNQPLGDLVISSSEYSSLPGSWYIRNTLATGRLGATAQRSVAALSMIASSSLGQSSAWILTGRSFSSESSSDDARLGAFFFGAGSAASSPPPLSSRAGPRRFFAGAGCSPPPRARFASANASFTSDVAIPLESWIPGSISSARMKLWIAFSRFLKPVM